MNNILIICNDSAYFLRHRRVVADALAERGHNVKVMTGGSALPSDSAGGWTYQRVPIERFSFNFLSDAAFAATTMLEILRWRPSAVHLITLKPAVIAGFAAVVVRMVLRLPPRLVITIPGLGRLMGPSSELQGRTAKVSRFLAGRAIRLLSSRRDLIFTFETNHDRSYWVELGLVRAKNSVVISGAGVDPRQFFPRLVVTGSSRLRILFASRLLKSKGLDTFIAAARILSHETAFEFLVAGMVEPDDPDGYAPADLHAETSISFLGEISDMPDLLRSVDLVVLPTRYGEGIPRILIEAAASGVAGIGSDLDGCREIIIDGETGGIIPLETTERMAYTLGRLIASYERDREMLRRHGRAAHSFFNAGAFSENAVVDRFMHLLTEKRR